MDEVIFATQTRCPARKDSVEYYVANHFNTTKYPNPVENIPHVICEVEKYKERVNQYIEGSLAYQLLVGSILTFIGSVFVLFVLRTTKFNNGRFFYYRTMAWAEVVHSMFMFLRYYVSIPREVITNRLIAIYSAHFYTKLELFITTFINWVSLWVSYRQPLAIVRPRWIPCLNSRRTNCILVWSLLAASIIVYAPFAVVYRAERNETSNRYEIIDWLRSDAITVEYRRLLGFGDYFVAMAFLISSCIATRTYRRAARDLAILKEISSWPPFFEEALKIRNAEMRMYASIFQVSESICLSAIAALMAILRTVDIETDFDIVLDMTYSEAESNLWRASVHFHLLRLQNFLYLLVHSTQVFRFLLLCPLFRNISLVLIERTSQRCRKRCIGSR